MSKLAFAYKKHLAHGINSYMEVYDPYEYRDQYENRNEGLCQTRSLLESKTGIEDVTAWIKDAPTYRFLDTLQSFCLLVRLSFLKLFS